MGFPTRNVLNIIDIGSHLEIDSKLPTRNSEEPNL